MRTFLAMTAALLLQGPIQAQTLFTYGDHKVGTDEFIRAFRKNTEPGTITDASVRNYLELYTRFKLKVQDAYTLHLDTLVNKQEDVASFRKQIEDQYMFDQAMMAKMMDEARQRSTKEVRISHIFIPFKDEFAIFPQTDLLISADDKEKARQKAEKAYAQLATGEDFGKIARAYSADSSVLLNNGDLGYITVFTLPYSLENVAYTIPLRGYSRPFASDKGYHILLKTAERPASGIMQVQQILISYDHEAGSAARQKAAQLTDSLYNALLAGASFDDLARRFSYDMVSASGGGIIPPIRTGTYDPAFEEKVFALSRDGEISKPFETTLGFHLVRRMQHLPADSASFGGMPWEQAIKQDRRALLPQTSFEQQLISTVGMKTLVKDLPELFRFSDGAIQGTPVFSTVINDQMSLLEVPDQTFTTKDWLGFIQPRIRHRTPDEYKLLWEEFNRFVASGYYRRHMENYNATFRNQINEFTEGNLLFEVMERKVWSKASTDTAELRKYYTANRQKYQWGKSADVIIFTTADSATAANTRKAMMADPSRWRSLMETSGGRIAADSARMDWKLVQPEQAPMKNKIATPVVVNPQDHSASFSYILKTYPKPAQKSFTDAKVQVVNDYQAVLEERWISALKKRYPIKVDEAEFARVRSQLVR